MTEFLTKNPDVALVEVKEKLYERLRSEEHTSELQSH